MSHNQSIIEILPLACAIALVLACMSTDVYQRRIPNCLTFPAAVTGLALALLGSGWKGFFWSILGLVVGFGLLFLPYYLGGMGAGDVKLMAALGALVGYPNIIQVFLYTAIAGGVLALVAALRQRVAREAMTNLLSLLIQRPFGGLWARSGGSCAARSVGAIPYGVAIGLGTLAFIALGSIL